MCLSSAEEDKKVDPKLKQAAMTHNKMGGVVVQNLGLEGKNMIFSPFSLGTALGMLLIGAKGKTEKQMLDSLFQVEATETISQNYKAMTEPLIDLMKLKSVTINSVNRIYTDNKFELAPDYLAKTKKYYHAQPRNVDFATKPEEARTEINKAVANLTKNMIKELMAAGSVTSATKLVLVNAIYFKGDWKYKFSEKRTKEMDFTKEDKSKVKVPMMYQTEDYRYAKLKDIGAVALQMPYEGDLADMIFILPDEGKDLATIEKKIFEMDLTEMFSKPARKCNVWLPKFQMAVSLNLNEPLTKMGVSSMFGDSADFSGISKAKGLKVSQVVQKCVIRVDEEGSEAAAATGVSMMMRSAPRPPFKFKADRPFIYLLAGRSSGMILFSGRLMDPSGARL